MSATYRQKYSHANSSARSVCVLCCFSDHDTAQGYEQVLTDSGYSLLRARHGMHAYWLAIATKPDVLVIDARDIDIAHDYLLDRLQRNSKLAKTPLFVITSQDITTDPDVKAPLSLLAADIAPTELAARIGAAITELKSIQQQNVDAFFSDHTGNDQEFSRHDQTRFGERILHSNASYRDCIKKRNAGGQTRLDVSRLVDRELLPL